MRPLTISGRGLPLTAYATLHAANATIAAKQSIRNAPPDSTQRPPAPMTNEALERVRPTTRSQRCLTAQGPALRVPTAATPARTCRLGSKLSDRALLVRTSRSAKLTTIQAAERP
jgi:hypothetical protein